MRPITAIDLLAEMQRRAEDCDKKLGAIPQDDELAVMDGIAAWRDAVVLAKAIEILIDGMIRAQVMSPDWDTQLINNPQKER